jgi:hypothetical protein
MNKKEVTFSFFLSVSLLTGIIFFAWELTIGNLFDLHINVIGLFFLTALWHVWKVTTVINKISLQIETKMKEDEIIHNFNIKYDDPREKFKS